MPQIRELTWKAPVTPTVQSTTRKPSRYSTSTCSDTGPETTPVAQSNYAGILIGLIRGPTIPVVVGTTPTIDHYNVPIKLLNYHSIFLEGEINRIGANQETSVAAKKRKLSTEEESVKVIKVEEGDDRQSKDPTHTNYPKVVDMIIDLPDVDPRIFELFMTYAYMGSYPVNVDTSRSTTQVGTYAKQHTIPHAPRQGQASVIRSQFPKTAATKSMAPPPIPVASTPGARLSTKSSSPQETIPPSIQAWLLAVRLAAPNFLNYTMTHIYSGLGKYFSLTPNLIHFVWQRSPPRSILSKFINDVLVVYWVGLERDSHQYIDRHPALDHQWMQLFNEHADLKATVLLGVRGRREMPRCEAYFVQPQMLMTPTATVKKDVHDVAVSAKNTKDGLKEQSKGEVQDSPECTETDAKAKGDVIVIDAPAEHATKKTCSEADAETDGDA